MKTQAKETFEMLLSQGIFPDQILNFSQDGEALSKTSLTIEDAEELQELSRSSVKVTYALELDDGEGNEGDALTTWARSEKEFRNHVSKVVAENCRYKVGGDIYLKKLEVK